MEVVGDGRPPAARCVAPWYAVWAPEYEAWYYENGDTWESSWDPPPAPPEPEPEPVVPAAPSPPRLRVTRSWWRALLAHFAAVDASRCMYITREAMTAFARRSAAGRNAPAGAPPPPDAVVAVLLAERDADGDGRISLHDLVTTTGRVAQPSLLFAEPWCWDDIFALYAVRAPLPVADDCLPVARLIGALGSVGRSDALHRLVCLHEWADVAAGGYVTRAAFTRILTAVGILQPVAE